MSFVVLVDVLVPPSCRSSRRGRRRRSVSCTMTGYDTWASVSHYSTDSGLPASAMHSTTARTAAAAAAEASGRIQGREGSKVRGA